MQLYKQLVIMQLYISLVSLYKLQRAISNIFTILAAIYRNVSQPYCQRFEMVPIR